MTDPQQTSENLRRLARWQPSDDVTMLRTRLACLGNAAVEALSDALAGRSAPPTPEDVHQACVALADGTNGNVPIQSVYEAMLRLIGRADIIDALAADYQTLITGNSNATTRVSMVAGRSAPPADAERFFRLAREEANGARVEAFIDGQWVLVSTGDYDDMDAMHADLCAAIEPLLSSVAPASPSSVGPVVAPPDWRELLKAMVVSYDTDESLEFLAALVRALASPSGGATQALREAASPPSAVGPV